MTEETLLRMKEDGVRRAVAFSQYPQYSCTTTGSSLNELWRTQRRLGLDSNFRWSIVDRYPTHPRFIDAVADRIRQGLSQFEEKDREKVVIIFSAHSLPLDTVDKGDAYVGEVAASAHAVMNRLAELEHPQEESRPPALGSRRFVIAWQSQVGPKRWMGPKTLDVVRGLAKRGDHNVLVVPIAFTCDQWQRRLTSWG
jgi:ferrochelatase